MTTIGAARSPGVDSSPVDREEPFYCSELSRHNQEQIFGTASEVGAWLLLEYTGGWARQILPSAELPDAVKVRLRGVGRSNHRTRLAFIKQAPQIRNSGLAGISFLVAVGDAPKPTIHRFQLSNYEDLLDLDIDGILRGRVRGPATVNELYLVCTHGKHDKCCAKFGMPVYTAASLTAGSAVWQSSHIGGDRFAGNMVCLPDSIYYGHTTAATAPARIAAYRQGHVMLDGYRGRSTWDFIVQAAEYLLRQQTGQTAIDAFQYLSLEPVSAPSAGAALEGAVLPPHEDVWEARFLGRDPELVHIVRYRRDRQALVSYLTCLKNEEAVPQYQAV